MAAVVYYAYGSSLISNLTLPARSGNYNGWPIDDFCNKDYKTRAKLPSQPYCPVFVLCQEFFLILGASAFPCPIPFMISDVLKSGGNLFMEGALIIRSHNDISMADGTE